MSRGTFENFLDALRAFESGVDYDRYQNGQIAEWQIRQWVGEDNWSAYKAGNLTWEQLQYKSVNSLGFVGYQLGEALLIDLGYYKDDVYYGNGAATNTWDGTFTGKNGIHSLEDLKTELQEHVIRDAFGYNLNVIQKGLAAEGKSLADFIGQDFTYQDTNGQAVTVTLSLTGILAAAHLRGAWGTLSLLKGGAASADENGTSILKYIQQFGGYDAPAVQALIDDYLDGAGQGGTGPDAGAGSGLTLAWAWGSHVEVDNFDPAKDSINLIDQFGENDLNITERGGNVVIEVKFDGAVQQSYTLKGVSLSELSPSSFVNVKGNPGFITEALKPSAGSGANSQLIAEAGAEQPVDQGDAAADLNGSGADEQVHAITWDWGTHDAFRFNPATDKLDFGSMGAESFDLAQTDDGIIVTIVGNQQSYLLKDVRADDLSADNFLAQNASAQTEIEQFLI